MNITATYTTYPQPEYSNKVRSVSEGRNKPFKQVLEESKQFQSESLASELINTQELIDKEMSSSKVPFPFASAPEYVKEAFESLSREEQFNIRWLTITMYLNKNLKMDALGRVTVPRPGDPGYIKVLEVFNKQGVNYEQYIKELVDYTERLKNLAPSDSYEKWIGAVRKFKHALINYE